MPTDVLLACLQYTTLHITLLTTIYLDSEGKSYIEDLLSKHLALIASYRLEKYITMGPWRSSSFVTFRDSTDRVAFFYRWSFLMPTCGVKMFIFVAFIATLCKYVLYGLFIYFRRQYR